MIFPGHLAAAAMAGKAFQADSRASLAASMFPDLVDKPLRWLLGITPNDRIPAHTLVACLLTTIVVRVSRGRRFAYGWLVGYCSHLLCDEINAHLNPGRIYFWWPFRRYRMHVGPTGLSTSLDDFTPASLLLEAATVLCAVWVWFRKAGHR